MSDKTIEEMQDAVRERWPNALLFGHKDSFGDAWFLSLTGKGSFPLPQEDRKRSIEEAWSDAYAKLPTPEPQEAAPQPNSTAPERPELSWLEHHAFELRNAIAATDETIISDAQIIAQPARMKAKIEALEAQVVQLRAEIAKDKWISVKDRVPILEDKRTKNQVHDVLVVLSGGYVYVGRCYVYRDGSIHWGVSHIAADCKDMVTHWLPLPAPPSERDAQEGR